MGRIMARIVDQPMTVPVRIVLLGAAYFDDIPPLVIRLASHLLRLLSFLATALQKLLHPGRPALDIHAAFTFKSEA